MGPLSISIQFIIRIEQVFLTITVMLLLREIQLSFLNYTLGLEKYFLKVEILLYKLFMLTKYESI